MTRLSGGTPKYNSDASAQPKLADAGAVIYACHRTIWGDDCQLSIEVAGGSLSRHFLKTILPREKAMMVTGGHSLNP